jgi:predicted acylesterase/phospholipase RssA
MAAPSNSSAVAKPAEAPKSQKLAVDDIQYLAFEGGGGKGFAYLGAIDMLEKMKGKDGRSVMARVQGFAGASAGAITALLLSIGYDFKSLSAFLAGTDFDAFYDPPRPRVRPLAGTSGVEVTEDSAAERAFIRGDMQAWLHALVLGDSPGTERAIVASLVLNAMPPAVLLSVLSGLLAKLKGLDVSGLKLPTAAKVILDNAAHYFGYLPNDMGLFSGQAARILFEMKLKEAAAKKMGGLTATYSNMTFKQHFEIFQKKLLFTGSNLRSGKTQLFSKDDTPNFPVADAVRISMGLPWVFKPYVIERQSDKTDPPCGVYVDGGVWNNLPFRELDSNPPETKAPASAAQKSSKSPGKSTPRTLGLRLEIDPTAKIESLLDFTLQMLQHGVVGSGESQVTSKYLDQCILLDTRGLDLLSFSPPSDAAVHRRILNRSRRAVCRYFDFDIDIIQPSIRDDADDEDSARAKSEAESCGSN